MRIIAKVLDPQCSNLCAYDFAEIEARLIGSRPEFRPPGRTSREELIEVVFSGVVRFALPLYAVATGAYATSTKERHCGGVATERLEGTLDQEGFRLRELP